MVCESLQVRPLSCSAGRALPRACPCPVPSDPHVPGVPTDLTVRRILSSLIAGPPVGGLGTLSGSAGSGPVHPPRARLVPQTGWGLVWVEIGEGASVAVCAGGPETAPVLAALVAEPMPLSSVSLSSVVSTSATRMPTLAAAAHSQCPLPIQLAATPQDPQRGGGGFAPGDGRRLCNREASSPHAYPLYSLVPTMVQPPPGSISPIRSPPRESGRL